MHSDPHFDVAVILGGGLYLHGENYLPTRYAHSDEFGMLGGEMRVNAALALYLQEGAANFLFSTGISAKQLAKYGDQVPPEAKIYAEYFLHRLTKLKQNSSSLPLPNIFLEDISTNTASNLVEVATILKGKGWQNIAIISSDYHIPRIAALFTLLQDNGQITTDCHVSFLSAEQLVREMYPGRYDREIIAAYNSPEALKRIENEKNGLQDIKLGKYVYTEYQLGKLEA